MCNYANCSGECDCEDMNSKGRTQTINTPMENEQMILFPKKILRVKNSQTTIGQIGRRQRSGGSSSNNLELIREQKGKGSMIKQANIITDALMSRKNYQVMSGFNLSTVSTNPINFASKQKQQETTCKNMTHQKLIDNNYFPIDHSK